MRGGLPFLYQVLSTSSVVQRSLLLLDRLTYDQWFLTQALNEEPLDSVYQTDKNAAADAGQELLFESDSLHRPNAAWTWSTDDKLCVFYFRRHTATFREWAYVMWDHERLKDWGILDVQLDHPGYELEEGGNAPEYLGSVYLLVTVSLNCILFTLAIPISHFSSNPRF
jgi:hypothetical protein